MMICGEIGGGVKLKILPWGFLGKLVAWDGGKESLSCFPF